ncbi:MAG: peptidoglycan-binding protein [Tetrasphaera sp.]
MTTLRTSLIASVSAVAVSVTLAAPALAAVPAPPKPPIPMPSTVDVPMSYQGQSRCDPTTKPGAAALAELLSRHYSRPSYGTVRACLSDVSEHYDGRAVDWMLDVNDPADKAIADAVTKWLTERDSRGNYGSWARRFGLMYVIWNRKVWKSYRDIGTWQPYTGSHPHTDHIHFSFAWDGACKRTSWWTGRAVTSINTNGCSTPQVTVATEFTPVKDIVLRLGSTGSAVRLAQSNLPGVAVDGEYGPLTQSAVRSFQSRYGLTVTGNVGRAVWNKMEQLQYPLIKFRKTVILKKGDTGNAVKKAQWALRMPKTGVFDDRMFQRVRQVENKYGLKPNGVIGPLTWAALDEELRARMRMTEASAELERVVEGALADQRS